MILHIHPTNIPSVIGKKIAETLSVESGQVIVRTTDKTAEEWRLIIDSGEHITIVAPIYWWGLSSDFESWFQDVFASGWAFDYTKMPTGLLQGKSMTVHLTHGTPDEYAATMKQNIIDRSKTGVFGYCGIETDIHFHQVMH
jgi:NAD(P)H dehydrogenase (quinone)